jgi:hypothetical protein
VSETQANTIAYLGLHLVNLLGVERAGSKTKVGELDVTSAVNEEVFRLEVTVNVTQLVEFVDTSKHLGGIEASVLLLEDTRVVEERTEVTSGYVLHGKVHMVLVLEGVEEADKPGGLDGSKNVTLDKNVLDLVHLGKSTLAHLFERADLVSLDLAGKVDRAVTALADLGNDTELVHLELGAALAEEDTLPSVVALELLGVCVGGDLRVSSSRLLYTHVTVSRVLLEVLETAFTAGMVPEEVN